MHENVSSSATILSRGIGLQYLSPPDQLEITWQTKGVCVVCEHDGEAIHELLRHIHERGWQAVLISLASSNPDQVFSVPQYAVNEVNEIQVQALLKTINLKHGPIIGFIGLGSNWIASDVVTLLGQQAEKRYVDFVFLMATQLKPALLNAAADARTWFITVNTMDGQFGMGDGSKLKGVVSGGLSALTKTLQREWPPVFCRAIDFSSDLSAAEKSQLLIQEMLDADRSVTEIVYLKSKRYTIAPVGTVAC